MVVCEVSPAGVDPTARAPAGGLVCVGCQEVDLEAAGPGGLVRVCELVREEIPPGERQEESVHTVLLYQVNCNEEGNTGTDTLTTTYR